jgi:acyl-[acyl carrier protein]--UDP-N-acetylglucosamine O-acyltransferase
VTSDYRIKKNVELLGEAFVVDDLQPITYFNEMTEKQDIGFLAHEVQELYPYLVSGSKDDNNGYQSLNYIGLIGILVKEIKELKRAVKELSEK